MDNTSDRMMQALRRSFGADAKIPTMFALYPREKYPDVWKLIQ